MQETAPPVSLHTILAGLAALASLLGIPLSSALTYFFTRRQYAASIHKTNAETGKTEAETRQIDSSILIRAYERLDDLEVATHQQGLDIIKLEQSCANVKWELGLSQQREQIHVRELALANAELKMLRGPQQPFSESHP